MLYSRKLTRHCKPTIIEKIKVIVKKYKNTLVLRTYGQPTILGPYQLVFMLNITIEGEKITRITNRKDAKGNIKYLKLHRKKKREI